jgi:hypothetical protein
MAAWMLPAAIALQAGGQLWGAWNQNKINRRNKQQMDERQRNLEGFIVPRLGQDNGMGQIQQLILDFVNNMDSNKLFGSGNQAWNTGQDALSQMLREDPYDPSGLFSAWEPIEQRALSQALADSFSQASGLGQRFGSSMMREEGRVRGEAAEGAAVRRQGAQMQIHDSTQNRRLQAGQGLAGMGEAQANAMLQMMVQQLAGLQGAGNLGAQKGNQDLGLLSLLFGQPMMGNQANTMPGAMGDIGGMLALLPLLMQMQKG